MHFDLADLRLFIHIAEAPSLTQGARRAHLSAAAASAHSTARRDESRWSMGITASTNT